MIFQTRECLLQLFRAIFKKKVIHPPRTIFFNFPHDFLQNNIFQVKKKLFACLPIRIKYKPEKNVIAILYFFLHLQN